jgi:hypothetical protein
MSNRNVSGALRLSILGLASLLSVSCGQADEPEKDTAIASDLVISTMTPTEPETFNERIARQKRVIPEIGVTILPAPEGDARKVAFAVIQESEQKCAEVTEAERLDGDGSIIAKCGDSDFRIFKVEGTATAMPLDCKVGRETFGVDACDRKVAGTSADDSIQKIMVKLSKM